MDFNPCIKKGLQEVKGSFTSEKNPNKIIKN